MKHQLIAGIVILALAAALAQLAIWSPAAALAVVVAFLAIAVAALVRAVLDARGQRRPTTLRIDVWQRGGPPEDEKVRRN